MILALLFMTIFSNADIKETYTADIKFTVTSGNVYSFKRIYESTVRAYNVYPDSFTDYDKRICMNLDFMEDVNGELDTNFTFDRVQ
jgi:hypothetical protein